MLIKKETDIKTFMHNNEQKVFVRTTIYIPRALHESAKIMAVLTRTNLSKFMQQALADKIKKIKEQPLKTEDP